MNKYNTPKSHTPRTPPGSRPSPAASRASSNFAGVRVTSARGSAVVRTTVTAVAANSRPALRMASDNALRWRIQEAIRQAFPVPRPYPGGGVARAFAASAARYGEAVSQAQSAAEETSEAMKYVEEVLSSQWWNRSPGVSGTNPGLTFIETRQHSSYGVGSGTWYSRPQGWGEYVSPVDQRVLGNNAWLRYTYFVNNQPPAGYLDNVMPADGLVPNNSYLYLAQGDYWRIQLPSSKNYYARKSIFRNLSGSAIPAFVNQPGAFPVPLGVPLPAGMPQGYPLARPQAAPSARRLPRPQRVDEIAIDIGLGSNPTLAVYRARARKPGKRGTETKAYGKSGIASVVFWLYEATDDWMDWINILVSAIPAAPSGMSPTQQLVWLRDNPHMIAQAAWAEVLIGLAGWAVDEAFGAFVGDINKRANRGISAEGATIDMRTNVGLHYSPANGSPGQFVTAFLRSFL